MPSWPRTGPANNVRSLDQARALGQWNGQRKQWAGLGVSYPTTLRHDNFIGCWDESMHFLFLLELRCLNLAALRLALPRSLLFPSLGPVRKS